MGAKEEKKKNKLLWIILIFIILFMLVSNKTLKNRANDLFFRNDKSLKLVNNIDISWPETGRINIYDDKIIRYDNNKIVAYDFEGDEEWKEVINNENSIVYFGEDKLYVAYTEAGKALAYDLNGKQLWTYDAKQAISRIAEKNGCLVLFTHAGENIEQVNILDSKGKLQANAIADKGKILTCSISPSQKEFTIITLDVFDGSISSSLIYYEMNGKEIWKKDYTDQVIYDVLFLNNDSMIVIYDNKIANINIKNDLLWSRDIEDGLKDIKVDVESKTIYALYGQADPILESISDNGRTKNKIELDNDYDNILLYKEYILLKGNKNIAGVNDEKIFLKYNCQEEIKGLGLHNDNIFIFASQNTMIAETISINDQEKVGD